MILEVSISASTQLVILFHAICFVLSASLLLTPVCSLCVTGVQPLYFTALLPSFLLKSFARWPPCFFPHPIVQPSPISEFLRVAELFTVLSMYNPGPHLPSLTCFTQLPSSSAPFRCFVTSIRYHVAVSYGSLQCSLLFLTILLKIVSYW